MAVAVIFQGDEALLFRMALPTDQEAATLELIEGGPLNHPAFPGARWGRLSPLARLSSDWEAVPRRSLWALGQEVFELAAQAWGLADWRELGQFCGRCGAAMADAPSGERARQCPRCHHQFFPVLSPAVIVAVEREGKILLARNVRFVQRRFSVLAGFVEVGETFEQAIHRELMEEVGLEVQDLEYFGSQHWPFPRSMMVGFRARWKSGELRPDGIEIVEAGWFDPDELPNRPGLESIAGRLIRDFELRHASNNPRER